MISINAVYRSVKACVKVRGTLTDSFDCHARLRQGYMISPILFSMRTNNTHIYLKGIQLLPDLVELFILLFADDIALLSDTIIGLQRQFL